MCLRNQSGTTNPTADLLVYTVATDATVVATPPTTEFLGAEVYMVDVSWASKYVPSMLARARWRAGADPMRLTYGAPWASVDLLARAQPARPRSARSTHPPR